MQHVAGVGFIGEGNESSIDYHFKLGLHIIYICTLNIHVYKKFFS